MNSKYFTLKNRFGLKALSLLGLGTLLFSTQNFAQSFSSVQTNPFGFSATGQIKEPTFVDIDNDGDLDVFAIRSGTTIVFWENTGTSSSPAYPSIQTNPFSIAPSPTTSIAFADIDGDGNKDLYKVETGSGSLMMCQNFGSPNAPMFGSEMPSPFGLFAPFNSIAFGDYDKDGVTDLINGLMDGSLEYYKNFGSIVNPIFSSPTSNPDGFTMQSGQIYPEFIDMDQDGDLDIMCGTTSGDFLFYLNTGNLNPDFHTSPQANLFGLTALSGNNQMCIANISGDVGLDILSIVQNTSTFYYFENSLAPSVPNTPTDQTPTANKNICAGTSTSLMVSGSFNGFVSWYDAAIGGNYLGLGTMFTTSTLNVNTSYFAQDSNSLGASPRREVLVEIKTSTPKPTDWYLGMAVRACAGESMILEVSGESDGHITWWTAATGGTYLGSGNFFTTPIITSATNFYAQDSTCGGVSTRDSISIILKQTPPNPNPWNIPNSVCYGTTTIAGFSGDDGNISWWSAQTGGVLLATGNYFTTPSITSSTTFYLQDSTCGGVSNRVPVTLTLNIPPAPNNTTTSQNMIACNGSSTTLSGYGIGNLIWWSSAFGGTIIGTGFNFTTPIINSPTTFYLQDSTCGGASNRVPVNVTLEQVPSAPLNYTSNANLLICSGATTTLSGVGASNGNISWWSDSLGGNLLGVGANFTTTIITTASTFYMQDSTCGGVSARTPLTVMIKSISLNSHPQSAAVYYNQDHTFSVSATGNNLSYQWTVNGVNVSGYAASFVYSASTTTHIDTIRCIVSNGCTSVVSNSAYLSIESNPIFVDGDNGNDANWGYTWATAFRTVTHALAVSSGGDRIFVKRGVYYPTTDENYNFITDTTHNQDLTFKIKSGVKIYGGFTGTETQTNQRINFKKGETNETVLAAANAYRVGAWQYKSFHVVKFLNVDENTGIDGFTIKDAVGAIPTIWGGWPYQPSDFGIGGGIYNKADGAGNKSNPTITNCYITENVNRERGAGLLNWATNNATCNPIITNCIFDGNAGVGSGKGCGASIYTTSSGNASPIFKNCKFLNNSNDGGHAAAFENWAASGSINVNYINCQISGNKSTKYIGAKGSTIVNGSDAGATTNVTITNCVFSKNDTYDAAQSDQVMWNENVGTTVNIYNTIVWDNSYLIIAPLSRNNASVNLYNSVMQNYFDSDTSRHNLDGMANVANASYPKFINPNGKIFKLQIGSPCLDAGLNSSNTLAYDLAGNARIQDGVIDMGAFEGAYPACPTDTTRSTQFGCDGNAVTIAGNDYSSDAIVYQTLSNTNGCDSIVETTLTFHSSQYVSIDTVICAGSYVTIGAQNFSTPGTHYINLTTIFGCDSTIELDITIKGVVAGAGHPNFVQCEGSQIVLDANYGAINFYGDDYITTPIIDSLAGISQFTFEATVYSAITDTAYTYGLVKNYSFELTNKSVRFINGDDEFNATFPVIEPNNWNHIAFVFDGTASTISDNYKVYVNGILQTLVINSSSVNIGLTPAMPDSYTIGTGNSYYGLVGKMRNVRAWKQARAQGQLIASASANHLPNVGSMYILEYLFQQPSGNTVQNTSATGSVYNFNLGYGMMGWVGKDTATAWNNQTYVWSDGTTNGDVVTLTAPHDYVVNISDVQSGCTTIDTIHVTLAPVAVPVITGVNTYCSGASTTLSVSAAFESYTWSTGDTTTSISANVTMNPISVTVNDANGCSSTSTNTNVTANALPTPIITGNLNYCVGSSANLSTSSFISYSWSDGSAASTVNATATNNPYFVTVIDANGCSSTSNSAQVVENTYPIINLGNDTTLCKNYGDQITLDAGNIGYVYLWNDNSTDQTLVINSTGIPAGSYIYFVNVSNGVCSAKDTVTLFIDVCTGLKTPINNYVRVYPNPTENSITITSSKVFNQQIEITNALGQIIFVGEIANQATVDLSAYSKGFYTIKIGTNESAIYKRIIKQ